MSASSVSGGPRQKLVLVTGSARSGTSSLAGSLHHLGLHVPLPVVPAAPRNTKGHFEPVFAILFHKKHLRRAGVRFGDTSPETEERLAAALAEPAVLGELTDWLALQTEPVLVVKDPHAVRFLDLWERAAEVLGIELLHLTALRHPAEVVGSRDMTWGHGRDERERRSKETSNVASWLIVALVSERATRGRRRAFIRYPDLLADWRAALGRVSAQLHLDLDTSSPIGTHELDTWLDADMRRSSLGWSDIRVPAALQDLAQSAWDQLDRLLLDPDDAAAMARLDEIHAAYVEMYEQALALVQDEVRYEVDRVQRTVARLRARNRRLRTRLEEERPAGGGSRLSRLRRLLRRPA